MDSAQALTILTRYTAGLSESERQALLEETATFRTVNGALATYYNPYAAATAHLMHPETVKSRSEGAVSETYLDIKDLLAWLTEQSRLLIATFPADDATRFTPFSMRGELVGW